MEELASELRPHHVAQAAVGTVTGQHPVRLHGEYPVGRFHAQHGVIILLLQADDFMFPAHIHLRLLAQCLNHVLLQIILLEIDHRRHLVIFFRKQIELVGQAVLEKYFAQVPAHAFVNHAFANTETVPYLQRTLGIAHGAGTDGYGVIIIQNHCFDTVGRAVQRRGEANRTGTDDHHLVALHRAIALFCGLHISKPRVVVCLEHVVFSESAFNAL